MNPILANAGIPMLAIQLPALVAVLIPIVVIEAWYLRKRMSLPWKQSLKASSIANVASTVIGVPLTWFALVAIEVAVFYGAEKAGVNGPDQWFLVPFAMAWLPWTGGMSFWPMVTISALVLSVPYYFVSVYSETWIVCRMAPKLERRTVLGTEKIAHLVTYALMFVASLIAAWILI